MLGRLEEAFAEREASDLRLRAFLSDASDGVRRSMRRIEEEARRMGVLVEDPLTLARLDELPALEQGRVDLAALVQDAIADGAADVLGNADALRQVIAILVRNALVHTPAGSPLVLSSRRRGEGHRGRERGEAGAGLGLAIVAAIVAAHGGEIRAADVPGGGACFTVLLPLERARGAARRAMLAPPRRWCRVRATGGSGAGRRARP
jgi:two-component system OmpR family sensor kinase